MSSWETAVTIVGLALITLFTRSFFLYPDQDLSMPGWLRRGLRYAPLAALVAVIAPEVLMTHGHLIETLKDARLPATVAAGAYYFWRRDILGTIVTGMAVLLPLRLGLGW
ncbi:branched-chain amino acid transporter [Sorangium cellulosum]|uniref:Branched-chain amino acid transporter n=1 Tax=Sorangium cellulosum TaxID=56 RepID=A0A2L0F4I0_SORCE|nr:AzlD domain-containing protein [Sorangium cellulosum]AUX46446.1 branched-chain amino acid transporter [Sorangium cellulosum]